VIARGCNQVLQRTVYQWREDGQVADLQESRGIMRKRDVRKI